MSRRCRYRRVCTLLTLPWFYRDVFHSINETEADVQLLSFSMKLLHLVSKLYSDTFPVHIRLQIKVEGCSILVSTPLSHWSLGPPSRSRDPGVPAG